MSKHRLHLMIFCLLSTFAVLGHALPFSINPTTTLPTTVIPGQTAYAFYTVTNNTATTRVSNYVKYLPPNVQQITTDVGYPNLCGATFTLTPRGTVGSSCTLVLRISGPVNGNDPDPHHHLFVCFPGGTSCAGTPQPLNVSAQIPPVQTRRYISNLVPVSGDIQLCSDSTLGLLTPCAATTSFLFNGPALFAINAPGTFVYVPELGDPSSGMLGTQVILCQIDSATGLFNNCANSDADGSAVFAGPISVALNGNIAYVSTFGDFSTIPSRIYMCTILGNGKLSQCTQTATDPNGIPFEFFVSAGITVSESRTFTYIGQTALNSEVIMCQINQINGALQNCINALESGPNLFDTPVKVVLNASTLRAYVSNNGNGTGTTVILCSVNGITGKFYNCQDSGVGNVFIGPAGLALNAQNTLLYVSNNGGGNVSRCTVDLNTGLLTSCINAGSFASPAGIEFK